MEIINPSGTGGGRVFSLIFRYDRSISTVIFFNMIKPHEPLHFGKEEILHFLLVLKYTYSDLKKKYEKSRKAKTKGFFFSKLLSFG